MSHRDHLPQLSDDVFLTDAGLETVMIFQEGIELPLFASIDMLKDEQGTEALRRYYEPFVELAADLGAGFVLESPTWRASTHWAEELGYSEAELDDLNRKAIALMQEIRDSHADGPAPIVISGCIGPHGDGYSPAELLSADEARAYHSTQIATFADTAADLVSAITMTYVEEAIGIARAAADSQIPVAISFTVETDGRLPSGQRLGEAIEQTEGETGSGPAYYMINCAHPTHFEAVLDAEAAWAEKIRGLRANASTKSHAELDEATELDEGDPADLARRYEALRDRLPRLTILGGCCGTDFRHVEQIARARLSAEAGF